MKEAREKITNLIERERERENGSVLLECGVSGLSGPLLVRLQNAAPLEPPAAPPHRLFPPRRSQVELRDRKNWIQVENARKSRRRRSRRSGRRRGGGGQGCGRGLRSLLFLFVEVVKAAVNY